MIAPLWLLWDASALTKKYLEETQPLFWSLPTAASRVRLRWKVSAPSIRQR